MRFSSKKADDFCTLFVKLYEERLGIFQKNELYYFLKSNQKFVEAADLTRVLGASVTPEQGQPPSDYQLHKRELDRLTFRGLMQKESLIDKARFF